MIKKNKNDNIEMNKIQVNNNSFDMDNEGDDIYKFIDLKGEQIFHKKYSNTNDSMINVDIDDDENNNENKIFLEGKINENNDNLPPIPKIKNELYNNTKGENDSSDEESDDNFIENLTHTQNKSNNVHE